MMSGAVYARTGHDTILCNNYDFYNLTQYGLLITTIIVCGRIHEPETYLCLL